MSTPSHPPESLDSLRMTLTQRDAELAGHKKARDDWEPDVENPDHTAPYDSLLNDTDSYPLPDWLRHVHVADLMREHNWSTYIDGWNSWEDSIRGERARRQTWDEYEKLCAEYDDAESARDDAQNACDNAEETAPAV